MHAQVQASCRMGRTIASASHIHGVHGGQVIHPIQRGTSLLIPARYEQIRGIGTLSHSRRASLAGALFYKESRTSIASFMIQGDSGIAHNSQQSSLAPE